MSPLSGYQMWKAGQAKARHKVKNWAARILTKQARKVQNHLIERWRIYRGDQVRVVAGKDKGQVGTVSKVYRKENRLLVEGLNLVKKHVKRSGDNPGGIITMEAPIHVSNVMVIDPEDERPTRIAYRKEKAQKRRPDGSTYEVVRNVRISKRTGKEL